jgi:hypothetical protein
MLKSYKVIKPYRHHGELKKPGCDPLRMTEAEAQYGKTAGQLQEETATAAPAAKPVKDKPAAADKPAAGKSADKAS